MRPSTFGLALAATLLPLSSFAATLSGRVTTPDGRALPLTAVAVEGPVRIELLTGADGRFAVPDLPNGTYTVALATPGLLAHSQTLQLDDHGARVELVAQGQGPGEQVVVTAERVGAPLANLGASVTTLDAGRIDARQAPALLDLLAETPGVAVARTGGPGPQGSAFVRGGDSNAVRVLIDGIPVNEPGGTYDLGSTVPLELERVEIVRGAASALYGTDALAGVIHLRTRQGAGPLAVRASAEGGSHDWRRGEAGLSGSEGRGSWNVGFVRTDTDGDGVNRSFRQTGVAGSLGWRLGEQTDARAVVRFNDAESGTPGQTVFGRPDEDASLERRTLVVGGGVRHESRGVVHDLRVGWADSDELSLNPLDSGSYVPRFGDIVGPFPLSDFPDPAGLQNDVSRASLGYQADFAPVSRHLVSLGVDVERETGALGSPAGELLEPSRTNFGVFAQDRFAIAPTVFLSVGARVERNDSFGTSVVPRGSLAWRVRDGARATTLKASAGLGIKEPTFFESFGVSFFARGNEDLDPERSRTVDVGVEQRLGSTVRAEATFFHHDYRDQIAYYVVDPATFAGSFTNVGHSRARGIELAVEARPVPALRVAASYTWLDGEVLVSSADYDPALAAGAPLLRRPEHQGSLWAEGHVGRLSGGATLTLVGPRGDSDFVGLGLTENDGHARLDARVRVRLAGSLQAFAAADNLLDREYMEVLGYPAPGRTVRLGLRWRPDVR